MRDIGHCLMAGRLLQKREFPCILIFELLIDPANSFARAAQMEHTILITESGVEVLTADTPVTDP